MAVTNSSVSSFSWKLHWPFAAVRPPPIELPSVGLGPIASGRGQRALPGDPNLAWIFPMLPKMLAVVRWKTRAGCPVNGKHEKWQEINRQEERRKIMVKKQPL